MTTEARILANRLNAQKSTGPNTPQGKAVVSQNALKHGLSARHDVITTESQADFDLHRDALLAELHPIGPMESILADRIVSLSWRLKRADQIQNQTIDALHEESTAKPFPALTRLLTPENQDPDLILGRIALKDFSNERVLDRLLMYERRIEHSLFKTMLEFQRLRLLKTLEHPNPAHAGIPIPQEPIINNQSSIVNIESTPDPPKNHPTSTIQHPASSIEYQESSIIAQNKPNFQIPKTNAKLYSARNYEQKPPQPHAKKQTQTKPIPPTQYAIPNTQYEKQTQSNQISNDQSQFQTQKQLTPLAGRIPPAHLV